MKRILLLFTLLLTLAGASYAQVHYKCTGQNVRVRTAPSLKSGIVQYSGAYGSGGPVMLDKGEIVRSLGVQRNGFAKVAHISSYNLWEEGWVSLQYLVRAQRCPECNGDGAHWCCDFTGKKQCSQCHGIGYK